MISKRQIKAREEATFCMMQNRNMFYGESTKCLHCKSSIKTIDPLASRCNRILYHGYIRRHNEVVRCIHLLLCNRYGLKSSNNIKTHSIQETIANAGVEIKVDTRIGTDVLIQNISKHIFKLEY